MTMTMMTTWAVLPAGLNLKLPPPQSPVCKKVNLSQPQSESEAGELVNPRGLAARQSSEID